MNLRAQALPFWIPAGFLLTGVVALTAAATAVALQPRLLLAYYATPAVLALVHTLTLGFAAATLVGAMHQLIPVVMVTDLHSPRLGRVCFWLFLPGSAGVVAGFATGYRLPLLVAGGSLVVAALLVFIYNLWRTNLRASVRDAVGAAMLASATYLTLTASAGVTVALGRRLPALAQFDPTLLHLGLGLFGTFFLAIAGAGHKLLGMFVLSHGISQRRLRLLTALVHAGLALLAIDTFSGLPLLGPAAAALVCAVLLFIADVAVILRARVRRRLGLPLRLFVIAPPLLVAAALLTAAGRAPAAVAAILFGFITLSIAGMYGKILGFLTWQHRYAARVGRAPVPLLNELALPWLDRSAFWAMCVAVPLIVGTQIVRDPLLASVGTTALAIAAWALLVQALWLVFGRHEPAAATAGATT